MLYRINPFSRLKITNVLERTSQIAVYTLISLLKDGKKV